MERRSTRGASRAKRRRRRGTGSLRLRGRVWWYRLSIDGFTEERSTGLSNRDDAAIVLRDRLAEMQREGTQSLQRTRRSGVTVGQLLEMVRDYYQAHEKASLATIGGTLAAWKATPWWNRDADALKTADVEAQAMAWQASTLANATINRRVSLLLQAYRRALKKGLITTLPAYEKLPEARRLTDKFSRAEIEAICSNLAPDYADLFRFACAAGIRRGQLLATTWAMIDTDHWVIVWPGTVCKSGEPHALHLVGELLQIIQRRHAARRLDQPLVFHHAGRPIRDLRYPLKAAFRAAGIPYGRRIGKVFHGTRRTAVTNLVESGVPLSVAMTISGHRTESMARRYSIHEADAQRAALLRAAEYVAQQSATPKVVPIQQRVA